MSWFRRLNSRISWRWRQLVWLAAVLAVAAYFIWDNYHRANLTQPRALKGVALANLTIRIGNQESTDNMTASFEWPGDLDQNSAPPLSIYAADNKICVDGVVYSGAPNRRPIEIVCNELYSDVAEGAPSWDWNANKYGLEIVDNRLRPVFQMLFVPPAGVVINGLFPVSGQIAIADCAGRGYRTPLADPRRESPLLHCPLIFKYPSWRYPGQFRRAR